MKLCFRPEQGLTATNTLVSALCLAIFIFAGKGRLRPFLARYIVLIWRELLLPLRFCLAHFLCHRSSHASWTWLIPCYQIPQNSAGCNRINGESRDRKEIVGGKPEVTPGDYRQVNARSAVGARRCDLRGCADQ